MIGELGEGLRRLIAAFLTRSLELHDGLSRYPVVGADLHVVDLAGIDQLHQRRAGRAEHRRRPNLNPSAEGESAVIPVRMDYELLGALTAKAENDGLTRSEAIREAIRPWAHVA